MIGKMLQSSRRFRKDEGVALLTTLLLLFLMSSMLVGFAMLLLSNQQLAGASNDEVVAFYAAEAGMEKMTADLGGLFSQTYSPSITQINGLQTSPYGPPSSSLFTGQSVTYTTADGNTAYSITPASLDSNGNPAATPTTIKSGPYQGMSALATDYTLSVNARTSSGREVNLVRTTQTVGIPMFQFAIFCDVDCSFHAGSNFTVQGRVHGNGNLFLASGATLTMQGKVDAYKDIIRSYMDNGADTKSNWGGTVNITTTPTGGSYRALGFTEGSWDGSNCIGTWHTVSTGNSPTDYANMLINGKGSTKCSAYSTGAQHLDLAVVTMGGGSTQPIDLIRRPLNTSESANVTGERYMAQSSLVILLSDNPTDIMSLPCVEQGTQPMDLSALAQPVANWPTGAPYSTLTTNMTSFGTTALPLAASASTGGGSYNAGDGYWLPSGYPIIRGFIKIQAQTAYGAPCGTWKDVTAEVLAYGYAGKNLDPVPQSFDGATLNPQWPGNTTQMAPATIPALPGLPSAQLGPQTQRTPYWGSGNMTGVSTTANPFMCKDPHPNAIIRLERIRDNPSTIPYQSGKLSTKAPTNYPKIATIAQACGVDPSTGLPVAGLQPSDFWPNTLFDPREGELRDTVPAAPYNNLPTLNGTMHYIELDAANLVKWLAGSAPYGSGSGHSTYDSVNSPNNYSVYISDRRGNYAASKTWTSTWPPVSPSGNETGEYGWNDNVNSVSDPTNGCPNSSLDTGEDLDGETPAQLFTYGASSTNINWVMAPGVTPMSSLYGISSGKITGQLSTAYGRYGFFADLTKLAISANPKCTTPAYASTAGLPGAGDPGIWPMMYAAIGNAARQNPPIFFRRAVTIVNGNNLTGLGTCPSGVTCGLAISTENPVYMQGDFNANSAGKGFSDPTVGASVAGDAVTILSNGWNDVNSFSFSLYANNGPRSPATTYWRAAVIGGKGVSFPTYGSSTDNGTDGGMHNFLREVENWSGSGGSVNYEGALVNLYTNRQANGVFKYGNTVYSVPTRYAYFDTNFLTPSDLPPRTPMFREINTTGWTRLVAPTQSYK